MAACFLSLTFGVLYGTYNAHPVQASLAATVGVVKTVLRRTGAITTRDTWWQPARHPGAGVVTYDQDRTYPGLTLLTSGHAQAARLVAMDGRTVHRWSLPFREAWSDPAHVATVVPAQSIHWETVHLYPNGDLLVVYIGEGSTPYGYGIAKLNKDSELLWRYSGNAHHDVDVGDDGRIYTLAQTIRDEPLAGAERLVPPFLDDTVVVLSPNGELLAEVSIAEAFARSDYAAYLDLVVPNRLGDYLHANQAEVVDAAAAARFDFAEAGQVLVSLRDIHTVALLDVASETIVWALRGPWLYQHDPDLLANGNMLLFDNRGHSGPGGASRVIEFDPVSMEIAWVYAGDAREPLFSAIRSSAQRLPNGNTLIVESDAGRTIEVAPDGDIVWEYVNPHRAGQNDELIAVTGLDAARVDPKSLTFLDQSWRMATAGE